MDKDLRQMLVREDAEPPLKISVRVWPRAIPQFNVGHLDVVQVLPVIFIQIFLFYILCR